MLKINLDNIHHLTFEFEGSAKDLCIELSYVVGAIVAEYELENIAIKVLKDMIDKSINYHNLRKIKNDVMNIFNEQTP